MNNRSKKIEGSRYGLGEVRGIMTNRGIRGEGTDLIGGVFDQLGLSIDELRGRKLLDVGTGGGKIVEEARDIGLDITGIDIAPGISLEGEDKFEDRPMVEQTQAELKAVAKKYPGSIVGADAAVGLPFGDNTFDIVFSNLGLPGYARSPKELAVALLEMIRVAKERVIINGENFKEADLEGVSLMGTGRAEFKMAYRKFLDFLIFNYGIRLNIITRTSALPAFHFDVTSKLSERINAEQSKIVEEAEKLRR